MGKGGFFRLGILHSCLPDGAEQSHHLEAQELSIFSDVWEEDEQIRKFRELADNLDEGELVKKAQEWGSKLWEILAKEGGEKGDRDCEATNNKKSGSRTCQTLKVGDWVVQEVQKRNSKLGERWEGPYEVKGFDEERGGYSLQEMDGRLLKDLSPIEHLKVVEKALDKEQAYEVEKIVGHRGGVNDREYQIKEGV